MDDLPPAIGRAMLDAVPQPLYALDAEGCLWFANAPCRAFLQERCGLELNGHPLPITCAICPPLAEVLAVRLEAVPPEGLEREVELDYQGRREFYSFVYRRWQSAPGQWSVLGMFRDITTRREAQLQAQAALKASQEAMRTRDVILSVIGHDLRTPIAQLNAMLFLMHDMADNFEPGKLREYAQDLDETTRQLSTTLDNLLHWSSSHRRNLEAQLQPTDAARLLEQTLGLLRMQASSKGVPLEATFVPSCPLYTDPDMLAFIMRNLVANAVKFTPAGGAVRVGQQCDAAGFRFEVQDEGVGMAADEVARALGESSYHSTQGTEGERGIGLGLKLCREFARKLEGELQLISAPEQGTTARLWLPVSPAPEPGA